MFLGNCKEWSVVGIGDAAEEGNFKKAEKVTAPSDVLRLSKIWDCAGGGDCRSRGRGGHSLLLQCPDYQPKQGTSVVS